jgi:hypothetical protein
LSCEKRSHAAAAHEFVADGDDTACELERAFFDVAFSLELRHGSPLSGFILPAIQVPRIENGGGSRRVRPAFSVRRSSFSVDEGEQVESRSDL